MSALDQHRERLHRICGEITSLLVDDPGAISDILAAVAHGSTRARERQNLRLEQAQHAKNCALGLLEPKRLTPDLRSSLSSSLILALGKIDDYSPPIERWAEQEFREGKSLSSVDP